MFSHRYRGERVLTILELLRILDAPGWWLAINTDSAFRQKYLYCVCADALEMTVDAFYPLRPSTCRSQTVACVRAFRTPAAPDDDHAADDAVARLLRVHRAPADHADAAAAAAARARAMRSGHALRHRRRRLAQCRSRNAATPAVAELTVMCAAFVVPTRATRCLCASRGSRPRATPRSPNAPTLPRPRSELARPDVPRPTGGSLTRPWHCIGHVLSMSWRRTFHISSTL